MRAIDGDALIKKCGDWYVEEGPEEGFIGSLKALVDTMPTVNSNPDDGWILCSDRMPQEREWLGTKRFGTTISDEVDVTFERPDGKRFVKHISFQNGSLSSMDQTTIDAFNKGAKPIAWKPRVEPYMGEE